MAKKASKKNKPSGDSLKKTPLPKGGVSQLTTVVKDGKDVEVRVFDVVSSFDPKGTIPWRGRQGEGFVSSQFVYDNLGVKLDINATGLDIGETVESVAAFVEQFSVICGYWEPDAGYGRQHYTSEGVMHNDGLRRLSIQGLGKMAAQALEELAQRASQVGQGAEEAKEASVIIGSVCSFGSGRTKIIKDDKRAQAYKTIEAESGVKILAPRG